MSRTSFVAALALLAAGQVLANPVDEVRPDAPELAPYGTFPIGVQTLRFVNPGQIDVLAVTGDDVPLYDRELTVEVWYPAVEGTQPGGSYDTVLRDGQTPVTLTGRAARDAEPVADGSYPLIVISHGYPGNRYLMSHLGENLASKGYITVAIDHRDSTYSDQAAFGSTLLNRPIDQRFVIDQMAALESNLGAITDTSVVGVIGYSMGGYGALVFGGAGVTQASTEYSWGTPNGLLAQHLSGSESHAALIDPRVRALIVIGPWGRNAGFWDANTLAGLEKPTLIMAGGSDDVSVYGAIRTIFEEARGTERHLLTFNHANHNAAAPIPAPKESREPVDTLDFVPFEHYADPVWDTVRMNNIAQHFATAFFDLHLRGDVSRRPYFDLIPVSDDGVTALDEEALPTDDHTYWTGFPDRTARGLRFETLAEGE
ncbi:alpha/beta fold hydrolase [uncultured Roseobacter sp.]|uniref:alpha/beta hydrolase family protein n=1 Tax=uncultured Roseobacter sp. TaxID=114847 RepID=UPI0026297BDC|nr:alpha/beta fold hydrolase [uncultured Roseobacter sp.]